MDTRRMDLRHSATFSEILSEPGVARLAPSVVPAQFLGFFTGTKKNLDRDNPKNLTRVVILG